VERPEGFYRLEGRLAPDAGARFSAAWRAHIDRIFCEARRAGRREPRAAYAADALVALASEGPCKPVQVSAVLDSAALPRGHTQPGERCEINGVPAPVTTLEARYPVCGVKGCADDQFLEIDHIVPLEDHGPTETGNLWRLCSHHHALKTYGGWRVAGENGDRDLVPP
jgi:hypothetical protein